MKADAIVVSPLTSIMCNYVYHPVYGYIQLSVSRSVYNSGRQVRPAAVSSLVSLSFIIYLSVGVRTHIATVYHAKKRARRRPVSR